MGDHNKKNGDQFSKILLNKASNIIIPHKMVLCNTFITRSNIYGIEIYI